MNGTLTYQNALKRIVHNPTLAQALKDIHSNPSYYSMWYLLGIEGSLFCKGQTTSEQNHSSIVNRIGKGANFSLCEHIKCLFNRYMSLHKKHQSTEDRRTIAAAHYKGEFSGQQKLDNIKAKKSLSSKAFKMYCSQAHKKYQIEIDADNNHHIWSCNIPSSEKNNCSSYIVIPAGERCPCTTRVSMSIQCSHELADDGKLIVEKFSQRWLNQKTYRESNPLERNILSDYIHMNNNNNNEGMDKEPDNDTTPSDDTTILSQLSNTDDPSSSSAPSRKAVTYQMLVTECEFVTRLISRKPDMMLSFYNTLLGIKSRAQADLPFHTMFTTTMPRESTGSVTDVSDPLPAVLGCNPRADITHCYITLCLGHGLNEKITQ